MKKFGPWPIRHAEIFAQTTYSFAFVNLKPVVPGHVLVAPKRLVQRFGDLSTQEVSDLWVLAQRVGARIEQQYRADALTLTIQVHIMPRRFKDFEPNDKVYDAIDDAAKLHNRSPESLDLDAARVVRTPEQMVEEAAELRKLFVQTRDLED